MIDKLRAFLKINDITALPIEGSSSMISFSINDLNYLFIFDKNSDPAFIQMMLPKVGQYTDWNDSLRNINESYKSGKVLVINNEIWFSVENFIYGNVDAPALFSRMISILRDMINNYRRNNNG